MISHFKRQFHGTRGIVGQIVKNLLLSQNSNSLIKNETQEPKEIKAFIEENIVEKKDKTLHKAGENYFFYLAFREEPRHTK